MNGKYETESVSSSLPVRQENILIVVLLLNCLDQMVACSVSSFVHGEVDFVLHAIDLNLSESLKDTAWERESHFVK